jgi:hypothetical protein
MTATLLLFVPVALLVLISGFCFVGCVLNTHGLGEDPNQLFTKYSDTDVIGNADIVAFWPLGEASTVADNPVPTAKAEDVVGGKNGNYNHKGNAPELYDCPAVQIPSAPPINSALANGFLSLGQVSLLAGDLKQPGNDPNVRTTGMQVNGGFVSVPFPDVIDPTTFTVEAWVRTEWDSNGATRAIFDSRGSVNSAVVGFVLWVNDNGNWEAVFDGSNGGVLKLTTPDAVLLGQVAHIVLTFDAAVGASIFVNGEKKVGPSPLPAGSTFVRNTVEPIIIGAGFKFLPTRTVAKEPVAFPLTPFNGTIQNVAVYKAVLADGDIKTHFEDGSGITKVPAG